MRTPLAGRAVILSAMVWHFVALPAAAQEWPATRPERSDYRETSRYDDVTDFLGGLEGLHPMLRLTSFGY